MALSPIVGITNGGDPEFFFTNKKGRVIGSEKVLPERGFEVADSGGYTRGKVVIDGVQAEIHMTPAGCRQTLANYFAQTVLGVSRKFKDVADVNFQVMLYNVSRKTLDDLSPKNQVLGCSPSLNIYPNTLPLKVDAIKYRKRSAGGHLHLGMQNSILFREKATSGFETKYPVSDLRTDMVAMLDIFLGNTSVLIDRDPNQKERRKNYGRAGEYRLPRHGLEYRVLSNFWTRHYVLMHFVYGLARIAANVTGYKPYGEANGYKSPYGYPMPKEDPAAEILKMVSMPNIQKAINNNDADLAWKNWEPVKEFLNKWIPTGITYAMGFESANDLPDFEFFARVIQDKGIDFWFPEEPVSYWSKVAGDYNATTSGKGSESYWRKVVHPVLLSGGKNVK